MALPHEPVEVLLDGPNFTRRVMATEVFEVVVPKVHQEDYQRGFGAIPGIPAFPETLRNFRAFGSLERDVILMTDNHE